MKNLWVLIIGFILSLLKVGNLSAQTTDTLYLYQCYNSFSNEEKAEWTSFENNWNYFDYSEIKKKYKIKGLNCKNCESLYANIYIEINEEGKVTKAHVVKAKKCGVPCNDKEFIKLYESSIEKHHFKSVKNKQFIGLFGHVLKC